MQFYENCTNQKKKVVTPSAQKWKVAPGGTVLPLGGFYCRKSTKTTFFANQSTPYISDMAPGGRPRAAMRYILLWAIFPQF